MKKKTAIPILLCAVCLVTLLRCQKTESDKSTETVNDSSSQNRLAEEAVLEPKKISTRKTQKFQLFRPIGTQCVMGGTVGTGKSKTQTQMHEFASCFFT